MKELSIEEKARAYDEALKKARILVGYPTTQPFISDLQDLFPELAESGDERIRKEIAVMVNFFYGTNLAFKHSFSKNEMLAWLEKQGEQKPAWSEEDKSMRIRCIGILETYCAEDASRLITWLKSLKDRYTWKPSDEQIRELSIVATGKGWFSKEILRELLEQLKKLRKE